ncbi:aminotransferase class III-fold pyridoxal phosphate-dependent enzyme [Dokdonia sp.]|uniref:aminotransferase class III-fold pyridoxal phosphate-dependent enzyme n=1 Tax=Dokdonia sp. TaxID=2024995 RepID=UPI00326472A5
MTEASNKAVDIIKNNLDYTLFSWSKQGGLNPLNIERAKGVYFWDSTGKKYLDFNSQLMNVNIGHGDQRITEAVSRQMKNLSFIYPGAVTEVRGELGKKIAELTPGNLTKTFFTNSGAEAIENAIKIARIYTGRTKIICQYRGYHGATYGAISAGGDPRKHAIDDHQAPGFVRIENPYFYRCPWNSNSMEECGELALRNLEQVINYENPDSVAAILMEGESGSSGCIKYPKNYWQGLRRIADKYGILLISDEVMSGFGRTGKWFGVDHHNVTPDIMALAKGLTSGYIPLGGTVVTDTIADAFNEKHLTIGLTYSAHAVGCAAGLENVRIIQSENLVENAASKGLYLEKKMETLISKHPSIGDFRNTGLLGCVELVKNRETKEQLIPWNAKGAEGAIGAKIAAKLKELGMFTFVKWNFIFLAPPLNITEEQIDEGIGILSKALEIADQHYEE